MSLIFHRHSVTPSRLPPSLSLELHIHRLPRMQLRRRRGIEDRFDHEHQLVPALPAVNHGRGVLGPAGK